MWVLACGRSFSRAARAVIRGQNGGEQAGRGSRRAACCSLGLRCRRRGGAVVQGGRAPQASQLKWTGGAGRQRGKEGGGRRWAGHTQNGGRWAGAGAKKGGEVQVGGGTGSTESGAEGGVGGTGRDGPRGQGLRQGGAKFQGCGRAVAAVARQMGGGGGSHTNTRGCISRARPCCRHAAAAAASPSHSSFVHSRQSSGSWQGAMWRRTGRRSLPAARHHTADTVTTTGFRGLSRKLLAKKAPAILLRSALSKSCRARNSGGEGGTWGCQALLEVPTFGQDSAGTTGGRSPRRCAAAPPNPSVPPLGPPPHPP